MFSCCHFLPLTPCPRLQQWVVAIDAAPLESDPRKFLFVQDLGRFKPDWNALENNYGGPEDVIAALLGCPSEGVLTTLNEHIAYHPPLWTELFCKLVGGGEGQAGAGQWGKGRAERRREKDKGNARAALLRVC